MGHLCYFCLVFVMLSCASVYERLWSPAGKGLTSWLSFVMYNCEVVTFPLYLGSDVVLDCIGSLSLPSFLLFMQTKHLCVLISN